jgi:ribonuclease-3
MTVIPRYGLAKRKARTPDRRNGLHQSAGSFRPRPEALRELQAKLGYEFLRPELLEHALTHRSAAARGTQPRSSSSSKCDQSASGVEALDYERFEFLGDAVIDLVVAHLLIDMHPQANEGELSKMRAALVNTKTLAEVALSLGMDECLILSIAERSSGGHQRPSLLADVFEAVTGALYNEAGYERAREVLSSLLRQRVATVDPSDPKTELQEMLHTLGCPEPEYRLEFREGPEHAPVFVSIVVVGSEVLGRGNGATKKASQQEAAARALERLAGFDEIDARFFDTE